MAELPDDTTVQGFVLAGGPSSRFGRDKALALHRERPLLSWALAALREVGLEGTVVSPSVEVYRPLAASFLTTERPGRGPVEGVRTALAACSSVWALLLGVDMPGVDGAALRPLLASVQSSVLAVCYADSSGRRHPFPGLYHREVRHAIERLEGTASMQQLLDRIPVRLLTPSDLPELASLDRILRNVNRPGDLP